MIENTRFKTNPWKNELQKDSLQQTVMTKMTKDAQKVGVDGKALSDKPSTPSVNGFKFLRMTPSPMLREDESPLMTWGEVESTPYRYARLLSDRTDGARSASLFLKSMIRNHLTLLQ